MEQKLMNIVLVPTDFSNIGQNAVNHGAEIAKFLNYKLLLLHVVNRETRATFKKENSTEHDLLEKLASIGKEMQNTYGIQTDHMIREGSIFEAIHLTASEQGANLMVLGTHGKKGLQHVFGSHALKVVTRSPVPTIVVQKRGFGEGYRNIVFPVNDFTEARQQVQWARIIANSFNSRIHIFRQPSNDPDIANKLAIVTNQVEEAFQQNNIDYTIVRAEKREKFARQFLSFAASIHADLIMIMTDADIFSPDFPAGQWDEKIMFNEAQIPVMCINPIITGKVFYEKIGSGL